MMVSQLEMSRFLGCIARNHLRPADIELLSDFLKKDVNWKLLLLLAARERVAGFLYYHLKDLNKDPPEELKTHAENAYLKTKFYSLAVVSEARALSNRFDQARLPVTALQGLSVLNLYKDPGLRPLGDIDLMVLPGRRQRLEDLLQQAGYRVKVPAYPELMFKDGIWVDIHTHILNIDRIKSRRYLFPENLAPMWENTLPLFEDHPNGLLCLAPFDNFIALCAHALKHSYSRLIWLVDLHEYLLRLTDNSDGWESLAARARFWGQERVVCYVLMLLKSIFSLNVPLPVQRTFGFYRLSILEKYILGLKLKGFSSPILCKALWLANIKRPGDQLKFVKETVFPKDEVMAQIAHDRLWTGRKSNRAGRILEVFSLGKDLYRALRFSFRQRKDG